MRFNQALIVFAERPNASGHRVDLGMPSKDGRVRESGEGKLLRIFVDEDDRHEGRPLHLAIVDALRAADFAGATVLKGIEGYGASKHLRVARALEGATGLPVLIEVIDEGPKIDAFMPVLRSMMQSGLITLEKLQLVRLTKDIHV